MGLLARLLRTQPELRPEFADSGALRQEVARLRGAYLELVKDCLIGRTYRDPGIKPDEPGTKPQYRPEWRESGLDWPGVAQTMIGDRRMINLWTVCEDVIVRGVPGDFIETGVWRGGACIFMRAILKTYGVTDRTVWVADSFEGLPKPDAQKYPEDRDLEFLSRFGQLAVPLDEVRRNFESYGLLDGQVRFLKGWFKDTLPGAPIERLAVLRLDGDMYESTMDALRALYPKLSVGGYAIVDDFHIAACERAVDDFRREHGIDDPIHRIDHFSGFWRKSRA